MSQVESVTIYKIQQFGVARKSSERDESGDAAENPRAEMARLSLEKITLFLMFGSLNVLLREFLHLLTFLDEEIRILGLTMVFHNLLSCFCYSPSVLFGRDYATFAQRSYVLFDVGFNLYRLK